jgi:hypothetical protein
MNLSGSLVVGLFTHPWAPLVACLPLLSIGYLLLVQSEMNQYDKLIAHALPDFPIAEVSPDEAAPMHVFDSAEAVLPWLGQQALAANVALQEVTQLQDQTGLAVRLKADFSQTAAFLQRLFYATNLVIEPSVQMELGASVDSPVSGQFSIAHSTFGLFAELRACTAHISCGRAIYRWLRTNTNQRHSRHRSALL